MMPVSATIVLAVFPEDERGRVMAIYAGISRCSWPWGRWSAACSPST